MRPYCAFPTIVCGRLLVSTVVCSCDDPSHRVGIPDVLGGMQAPAVIGTTLILQEMLSSPRSAVFTTAEFEYHLLASCSVH